MQKQNADKDAILDLLVNLVIPFYLSLFDQIKNYLKRNSSGLIPEICQANESEEAVQALDADESGLLLSAGSSFCPFWSGLI